MITRIQIEHFKSISSLDLYLKNVAICVGKNASGKSNFLDAISFLSDVANDDIDHAMSIRHGVRSVAQWAKRRRPDIKISINFKTANTVGTYSIVIRPSGEKFNIQSESGYVQITQTSTDYYHDEDGEEVEVEETQIREARFDRDSSGKTIVTGEAGGYYSRGDPERRRISFAVTESVLHSLSTRGLFGGLSAIGRLISDMKMYRIYPNTLRIPEIPSSEQVLAEHGENAASIFKKITSKDNRLNRKAKKEIISSLKLAIPELDNISVRSVAGYVAPVFQVQEAYDGAIHQYNASQLSDGTLRLFGLLLALYQPSTPAILAIEEPEQNINPGMLAIIAEAIDEVSRHSQILVATHSPQMMNYFPVENFIAFEKRGDSTVSGSIEKEQIKIVTDGLMTLGELSLIDSIRADASN